MKISVGESYPYLLDWKQYIRPETIVVIDADQVSYTAAASNESRSIQVIHKASGRVKDFSTRTEFYGNKKIEIGGWLGNLNAERETKNLPAFLKEDFNIVDVQTPNKVEFCLSSVKGKINHILSHLGLTKYKCILGGKNNFRLNLPSPNQYKSNRDNNIKPLQLTDARDYITKYHNAELVDFIESDDLIAELGYQGYLHFKEHGWFSYIVASFDKDQCNTPCLMFNTYADSGVFKHPIPILIDDGVGNLFIDNGKVKGSCFKFTCLQLLIGDSSDAITPYQPFKIRFGETAAYKLIQPLTTKKECLEAVIKQYAKWFPEGVKFTNWDGNEITLTHIEWLDTIYKMVHMKLSKEDGSSIINLIQELGIKDY